MRTQTRPFRLVAAFAAGGLLFVQMPRALAQDAAPQPQPGVQDQQAVDPPARAGRLARINGSVSFHGPDDSQWSPAPLNYPVTTGSSFWTQPGAQAAIEVSASRMTMAPATELDIESLTDTAFQATEPQGEVYLHLQPAVPGETYAVQTPRGTVTLAIPGRYGIVAGDTQNPTTLTVVEGSARVEGPGVILDVGPNQTASITGVDTFQGEIGPAQRDPFLTAMLDSERPPPRPAVVPPPVVAAMPGGEDLSQYGSWAETPDYGQVWYPPVAPDWAPYRDGSWAYVAPWGWTWVDSAPWGFAPFHYGRWVEQGRRWCWVPGGRDFHREPVYAPALVTFLGVGAVVGVGIGAAVAGGRIGWVPLGPREPYHPWYHTSDRYFREINQPHVTNVSIINRNVTFNTFVNRGAATVVPASVMTASRPVRPSIQRADPAQLAQARPVIGQQPLRPATTTAGVTPAVARQLSLPQQPGSVFHPVAPGPTIRTMPAAASPMAHQGGLPPLHGAGQNAVPTAAGVHPLSVAPQPALRAPVSPGQSGPPPIQHQPSFGGPGAVTHTAPMVNQGMPQTQVTNPAAASSQVHVPPPAVAQPAPGALFHPTSPTAPTVTHAAPAQVAPQVHAEPQQLFHPAANPPPPVVHPAAPPPQALHPAAPPPAAPAQVAPQVHAAPQQMFHPAAVSPRQVVHPAAPPPQAFHAAAPPPPAVHISPPPQIHAAPPPPPAPHPAPQQQSSQHKRPGEP